MDELADSVELRRKPKTLDTSDRTSISEDSIVRQAKTTAEACPTFRGDEATSEPLQQQPQYSEPQYSEDYQQRAVEEQEAFVSVSKSQQQQAGLPTQFDDDEEIISVSQQESPEEEAPTSPVASTKPHVSFADEATVAHTQEGSQTPPPSPEEKSEEPVLASETESSIKEAATRLATEQAQDF